MQIVNVTNFDIGSIPDYAGICQNCATPLEYAGNMLVIKMRETEKEVIFVPLDRLFCPECGKEIHSIIIQKTMDITQELEGLKK